MWNSKTNLSSYEVGVCEIKICSTEKNLFHNLFKFFSLAPATEGLGNGDCKFKKDWKILYSP